jgi:hypothetical protein
MTARDTGAALLHLANTRILLEKARVHARIMGSTEGDDIEGQVRTTLRDTNSQRCTTCGFPYLRGFGRLS